MLVYYLYCIFCLSEVLTTHRLQNFSLVIGDDSSSILFLSTDHGKQWYPYAILHGVLYQNTGILINTTARTKDLASNFTYVTEER